LDVNDNIVNKLLQCHSSLKLNHGTFSEELPEQVIALLFLNGDEKVLEIGGNIGRKSLIISSIIDSNNLVVVESDKDIAKQLDENRVANNFNFKIVDKALSKHKLIQKGWTCIKSDIVHPGYKEVDIISYSDLKSQYNIVFDTLIIDCGGAFSQILLEMVEILENIKTIIIENDFYNYDHKKYFDSVLKKNNFNVVFSSPLLEFPDLFPQTKNDFYQVWKRE
jgi:FkbM family methyltransferase